MVFRKDIAGLRGFAVLTVVIFHLFPSVLPGGFVGVDIFFVISGYLITSIILESIKTDDFSFSAFYEHRIRRLLPPLLIVISTSFCAGWYLLLPDELALLSKHGGAGILFLSNVVLFFETGYFDISAHAKPFLHLWSLGVEEQFYILWPILIIAALRVKANLLIVLSSVVIISLLISIIFSASNPDFAFFLPFSRIWELGLGGLVGFYHAQQKSEGFTNKKPLLHSFITFTAFLVLLVSVVTIDKTITFPGAVALLPVFSVCVLIMFGPTNKITKLFLENRILVFFGAISYSLYLWHWPLFSFHEIVQNTTHRDARLAIFLASIVLATFSTFLLENPIRKSRRPFQLWLLLFIALSLLIVSILIYKSEGYEHRFDPVMVKLNRDLKSINTLPPSEGSWCDELHDGFCSSSGSKPEYALFGDSHARALYWGMRDIFDANGASIVAVGRGRCPPVYISNTSTRSDGCTKVVSEAIDKLIKDKNINTVFVTYNELGYADIESKANASTFLSLETILSMFRDSGKNVYYLHDVPNLGFDARSCIPKSNLSSDWQPEKCFIPYSKYVQEQQPVTGLYSEIVGKVSGVKEIFLADALCESGKCLAAEDEAIYYTDSHHLSLSGAKYVSKYIGLMIDSERL